MQNDLAPQCSPVGAGDLVLVHAGVAIAHLGRGEAA